MSSRRQGSPSTRRTLFSLNKKKKTLFSQSLHGKSPRTANSEPYCPSLPSPRHPIGQKLLRTSLVILQGSNACRWAARCPTRGGISILFPGVLFLPSAGFFRNVSSQACLLVSVNSGSGLKFIQPLSGGILIFVMLLLKAKDF